MNATQSGRRSLSIARGQHAAAFAATLPSLTDDFGTAMAQNPVSRLAQDLLS